MRDPVFVVFSRAVDAWSVLCSRAARREGWGLLDCEGSLRIERYDAAPGLFTRDDQVVAFCQRKALRGSRLHLLALYLEGRRAGAAVDVVTPLIPLVNGSRTR